MTTLWHCEDHGYPTNKASYPETIDTLQFFVIILDNLALTQVTASKTDASKPVCLGTPFITSSPGTNDNTSSKQVRYTSFAPYTCGLVGKHMLPRLFAGSFSRVSLVDGLVMWSLAPGQMLVQRCFQCFQTYYTGTSSAILHPC